MNPILIVDDVAANRRLLRAVLEAEGMATLEAGDGVDALGVLSSETIEAVISDVLMPHMDGFRLCLEVRRNERLCRLPFIIYTSTYDSPAHRKLALDAGADDYLVRPAPTTELLKALNRACERAMSLRSPATPDRAKVDVFEQYNAALVAKLEERNQALLHSNADLRASEERFRELAESISEVFWLADPGWEKVFFVSPAFRQLWGRPPESLYANPEMWIDVIHDDDRRRVADSARTRQLAATYHEEYRIVRPDGSIRWIRDRAFPVRNAAGITYRIAGVAEDITERKQLEEQIRRAQKMEAIGTLAGGIAHDFNNILTAINGYTNLASLRTCDDPVTVEYLQAVLEAGRRATDLVGQILAFSRMQEQQRLLVSLRHVVAEAVRLLRATIPASIEFDVSLAASAPSVIADTTQIHQIVMNLCTNAAHAMRDGVGRLTVRLEGVHINHGDAATRTGLEAGDYTRLTVGDTGHGMERAVLDRIFDPFFTTKPAGEGTGLGLAVVHGIMESHGGHITVDSRPGAGTAFQLYLPAGTGNAIPPRTEPAELPPAAGERVLLVDDERQVGQVTMLILRQLGYSVELESSPLDALAMFRVAPDAFDVVMTDLTMPRMTGVELAKELHRIRPDLPVLLVTGFIGSLPQEKAREGGFCEVLQKPVPIAELSRALQRALTVAVPACVS